MRTEYPVNQLWKCCKRKCSWIGTDEQKCLVKMKDLPLPTWEYKCPRCGGNEFYEHKEKGAK